MCERTPQGASKCEARVKIQALWLTSRDLGKSSSSHGGDSSVCNGERRLKSCCARDGACMFTIGVTSKDSISTWYSGQVGERYRRRS